MKLVCETIIPPLPSTERGMGCHFDATINKEKRFLYCSGNLVVQRNLEEINTVKINAEHSCAAKVAKFSPNGEWICSGDASGLCNVWANRTFVIKNSINVGKCVTDIAWSHDGQRIAAVAIGKDDKGKVFPWNTNNKLGELGGATKDLLCCDFKPNRPFRVIAGSKDFGVYYYKGPPFKFETYDKTHKNYVNGVSFKPDGTSYVSVSSDKKVLEFDAKTGKLTRTISDGKGKDGGHKGTIYDLAFNKDGTHFVTCSADKTCKIWNFEKGEVIHTYKYSDKPTIMDMQVGCTWAGDFIISVSLNGKINYLDPEFKQEKPIKILTGHRKGICDMDVDYKNNTIYTVDQDARMVRTECKSAECEDMFGSPHKGTPFKFVRVTCESDFVYSVANDDTVCLSSTGGNKLGDKVVKVDGSARGIAVGNCNNDLCVVPTHKNKVTFLKGLDIIKVLDVSYTPTSCNLSKDDKYLAVGGNDKQVHVYNVDDFKEEYVIKSAQYIRGDVNAIEFHPNGELLATADKDRNIWIWDIKNKNYTEPFNKTKGMKYHGSTIGSISWSPDGSKLLSCAFDSTIYLWLNPTEGKNDNIYVQPKEGVITFFGAIKKMKFLTDNRIVGIGDDGTIRFFDITNN